jgi:hypothetical protein
MARRCWWVALIAALVSLVPHPGTRSARAEGDWEITSESEAALQRGLDWLARNQGRDGNWDSNDLGLVGMGTLAFLAAGQLPGRGQHGEAVQRSLDFVVSRAQKSGKLNIADAQRDMYNHGLATFVLGQAQGMTSLQDQRLNTVLSRALRLIADTQCEDGGWDYRAKRQPNGHDLSLAVMQAKALRSAMDCGFDVSPEVVDQAIRSVRDHYSEGARAIHIHQRWRQRHDRDGGLRRRLLAGIRPVRRLAD